MKKTIDDNDTKLKSWNRMLNW